MKTRIFVRLTPTQQDIWIALAGLLALLSVPAMAYLMQWQWQPENSTGTFLLYLVSLSAGPFLIVVFCTVLLWHLRLPVAKSLLLILILGATLAVGMVIKSEAKKMWQEPRPYALWMADGAAAAVDAFYRLPDKGAFILEQEFSADQVPSWQQQYWAEDTGFSFPSGHTYFAAQWALLMLMLLWRKKTRFTLTVVFSWALLVEVGRLALGMHWPADLAVSCLLAAVLTLCAAYACRRWVFNTAKAQNAAPTSTPALTKPMSRHV